MTPLEQESILTLALMAAFADGAKHDTERAELKRIAERLPHADVQPMALYQRVLLKQVTEQARSMHSRYADDIQQKAGSVNVSQLLPLIRGQQRRPDDQPRPDRNARWKQWNHTGSGSASPRLRWRFGRSTWSCSPAGVVRGRA